MIPEEKTNRFIDSIKWPVALILLLLVIHIIKVFAKEMGYFDLAYLGIFPRKLYGLKGILTSPLIHGDWQHLFANSIPLLSLLTMCMYFYRVVAIRGIAMIWILTGISVWLLGNFFDDVVGNSLHIGASGVVYGLVAFVFWNGVFVKSRESIVLALVVLVLFAGMFEGILPTEERISWESHLFGGFVGIFTAYFYKEDLLEEVEREKNLTRTWADEFQGQGINPNVNTAYFLPRDIFEKTKEERQREQDYYDDTPPVGSADV